MCIIPSSTLQPATTAIDSLAVADEIRQIQNDNIEDLRTFGLGRFSKFVTLSRLNISRTVPAAPNGEHLVGVISASSPGALTMTLPASSDILAPYRVKIYDETGNCNTYPITITPNSGQTINGSDSSLTLSFNYGNYELLYVTTDTWIIIGKLLS